MTRVTAHGGVGEIGGNKILIEDLGTRILLDFGVSFASRSKFYSSAFLSPRSERSLLEFGILPNLEGLYRFQEGEAKVDAVFLSHSHLDHAGYIGMLKPNIPLHCGAATKAILESVAETRPSGFEFDLGEVELRPFRTGESVRVGSMEVEPIHVDHSVPGAYGLVIHTSTGSIAYSGDYRVHGSRPMLTHDFLEAARRSDPIAMISEATNLTHGAVSSEPDVKTKLQDVVAESKGLVLADFSRNDLDRLRSFIEVAKVTGRRLGISLRHAHLLKALAKQSGLDVPDPTKEPLLVFKKSKKTYYKWEREMMASVNNLVDASALSEIQSTTILAASLYDFEELLEIDPVADSCYVLSASEPFNEETELDYQTLLNWLNHYGLPYYHIHVSGHMMPQQLKAALRTVNAKRILPVHCEYPNLFAKYNRDLGSEVILPEVGKAIELS